MDKKQIKEAEEKLAMHDLTESQVAPEIFEALGNEYVDSYRKGHLVYTREFYQDMYRHIHDDHMTYVKAYEALGFDVIALGSDRANSAGKRALSMAKDGSLFKVSPGDFNGTIPLKEMEKKGLDQEHMAAYLEARCLYLEAAVDYYSKKKHSR